MVPVLYFTVALTRQTGKDFGTCSQTSGRNIKRSSRKSKRLFADEFGDTVVNFKLPDSTEVGVVSLGSSALRLPAASAATERVRRKTTHLAGITKKNYFLGLFGFSILTFLHTKCAILSIVLSGIHSGIISFSYPPPPPPQVPFNRL